MVLRILIILSLTAVSAVSHAQADASGAFYDKNSTRNVFGPRPEVNPQPEMKYFPEKPVFVLEQEKKAEGAGTKTAAKDEPAKSIIEEFGDPETDVPVLAIAEAPKPFKGMMKSLQDGNDDLAYRYAKQYARYLRDFEERTSRVAGLTQLAMVSEGSIPETMVKGSLGTQQDYKKLTEDLQAQREKQKSLIMRLDGKALALVAKAQEDEVLDGKKPEVDFKQQLDVQLQEARREVSRRQYPRAADGKLDVLVFFRSTDDRSLQMLSVLDLIARSKESDRRVSFSGIAVDTISQDDLASLRGRLNVSFLLESKPELLAKFPVNKAPTTVIVVRANGEALVEEGERSPLFFEELLKAMQIGGSNVQH